MEKETAEIEKISVSGYAAAYFVYDTIHFLQLFFFYIEQKQVGTFAYCSDVATQSTSDIEIRDRAESVKSSL